MTSPINPLRTPQLITPIYSPSVFLCSSDYSEEDNFKYIYQIYDENGMIVEKRVFPLLSPYNNGRMDVSPILKNYFGGELNYDPNEYTELQKVSETFYLSGCTVTTNSIKKYEVKCGLVSSLHSVEPATLGYFYALGAVDSFKYDFNFNDYILSGSTSRFLTNSPTTINVYPDDYYTLSCLNGEFSSEYISDVSAIVIRQFNSIGERVHFMLYVNGLNLMEGSEFLFLALSATTSTGLTNVDSFYLTFNIGPNNIPLNPSTSYYTIHAINSISQQISQTYRFNVNRNYTRYGKKQIAFLNRHGNYSYFTFVGKSTENINMEKNTFLKNNEIQTGGYYTPSIENRGTTIYNSKIKTEYVFRSDYIDQETYDFMEELFTSPDVYYLSEDGAIPLIITDTDWEKKKKINDKVISFEIKCESSNKKKSVI